jgi:AcrR family transcriptional regulator
MASTQTPDRANEILNACETLLVEKGAAALSASAIAKEAGVNKALVFYYWGSLPKLVEAAIEGYYARHKVALAEALEDAADLTRFVDVYFDFMCDHQGFARVVQEQVASRGPYTELVAGHLKTLLGWTEERLGALLPNEGPLAARHFQLSFSAAVINYFTYAPIFGEAWGIDPLSKEALEERRAHLHWIVDTWMQGLAR